MIKTAMVVSQIVGATYGGWDNLALTAEALGADRFTLHTLPIDKLENYQCIIVVDNTNYNIYGDICIRIREKYPNMLIGWHQEKEVDNIFHRHRCHYDMSSSEESWCISSLKVIENLQVCDFIILHNEHDRSPEMYEILAPQAYQVISGPFLPVEEMSKFRKPKEEKRKRIAFGHTYGWREGGFLGYMACGDFKDFELWRWDHAKVTPEKAKIDEIMRHNFHKRNVAVFETGGCRRNLAKFLSECYIVISMREPTAGRTNALCAAVGTPIIGTNTNTTQQILFPDLAVDKYDLKKIHKLVKLLIENKTLYNTCVDMALNALPKVSKETCGDRLRSFIESLYANKR